MIKLIIFLLSITTCYAQSSPTITVENGATKKEIHISVKKSEVKHPPILAVEGGTADPQVITTMWSKDDSLYYATITLIYLNLEPDTIGITAKNFLESGGTVVDGGGNTGIKVVNNIIEFYSVGDWLKYSVNLTGKKEILLRFSNGLTGNATRLEIRKDSITGEKIAELSAVSTGAWNTFLERAIPILIDTKQSGSVNLYFVVSGTGNAYWGNLDYIEFR